MGRGRESLFADMPLFYIEIQLFRPNIGKHDGYRILSCNLRYSPFTATPENCFACETMNAPGAMLAAFDVISSTVPCRETATNIPTLPLSRRRSAWPASCDFVTVFGKNVALSQATFVADRGWTEAGVSVFLRSHNEGAVLRSNSSVHSPHRACSTCCAGLCSGGCNISPARCSEPLPKRGERH